MLSRLTVTMWTKDRGKRRAETSRRAQHLTARVCALLRAMRSNTNVLTLDLSNNHLSDIVGEAVGKLLLKNKRLRGLNLSFNGLTSQTLGPLGVALQTNTVLTSLSLESNPIMANTAITTSSNGSTDKASLAVAMVAFDTFMVAIAVNTTLTSLNLFNTQMTFDVSRALARALESNTALIALEVGGNSITQSDIGAIACKLQKNQLLQADAQEKHARVRHDIKQSADAIHEQQQREAKQRADAEWHDANAKKRADQREKEEWERARVQAEEEVRLAMEIEAQQKKYLQAIEEKNAKPTKGKK